MPNKKIIILDYRTATVYVRELSPEQGERDNEEVAEEIAESIGIELSDCEYMTGFLTFDTEGIED